MEVFEKAVGSFVFSYALTACVICLPNPFMRKRLRTKVCREVYASPLYTWETELIVCLYFMLLEEVNAIVVLRVNYTEIHYFESLHCVMVW